MTRGERQFVKNMKSGDPQAFAALYATHGGQVLGFALRLTGERAAAEDLTQDVFLAAYAGRATYSGRSSLRGWLCGIAVRRWRDTERRHAPNTTDYRDDAAPSTTAVMERCSLENGVVNALTLDRALARLAPSAREALLLVASQGLTYKEAAEALGEPVGTVKWRVSEATRKMQSLLNESEEGCDE